MAISTKLRYAKILDLSLDPNNPRLGSDLIKKQLSQPALLDVMRDWELEELAVSFIESGFWPQEALLIAEEKLYGESKARHVVVEGNRRLAALMYLQAAIKGKPATEKWHEIARQKKVSANLF